MGISGLLPFLEKATRPCHIAEFRGATAVVDTYCWLHKAATASSFRSAEEDTQVYINYCMKYIKLLQSHDITPILVFDGKNLPAKSETELKRRESRNKAKQRAAELLRLGKTEEARSYLLQSVNITPEMASAVIKECQKIKVDCIVAPYESDAQLAYFNIKGIAEIVITEDSDLMLFGCTKVVYKMDLRGCGNLVEAEKIYTAIKFRPDSYSFDKFRYMCILSGCDYVDSLPGIGLKKAEKFFMLTEETNPEIFLDKVPRYLNMRHLEISEEYKEKFMIADATFRHQTVFDPFKKKLVPLTDPQVCGTNPKYCKNAGDFYEQETAYQVALGNLHPSKHTELNSWSPTKAGVSNASIWSGVYKKRISRKQQLLKAKVKVETKTEINIETDNYEQMKAEEDRKIEEEIQYYCRKSTEELKSKTDNDKSKTESQPEKETETSPVLKRNPFIKKLSRFKTTSCINEKVIVKSRYFCKSPEKPVGVKTEENFEDKNENTENNEYEVTHRKLTYVENCASNIICLEEFDKIKINETVDCTAKDENDDLVEINLTLDDVDPENKNEKPVSRSQPSNSKKSPIGNNNQKRKKLGSCRSVGLKRTKSEGQQTLHSFFNKVNKK